MLRIDVTPREGYTVPKDNPFVARPGARPEIWTYGMRNPWRFSFDRQTGVCYAGDVGQNLWEEVDVIEKGGNYGWRPREGTHPNINLHPREEVHGPAIDPITEYGRDKGQSVTGGYVYRGKKFPALAGMYLYADYASGRFFGLRYENGKVSDSVEFKVTLDGATSSRNRILPSSFGQDKDGELYVCDHGHRVVY